MKIWLIRHGETDYNREHRYQGQTDIPLSAEGRSRLIRSDMVPEKVYVSRLQRASQTADILFPGARQIVVPGLEEMDFGRFDGRTHDEMMREDPAYRTWLDGGCRGEVPGGESREAFTLRIVQAVTGLVRGAAGRGESFLVIVAHGGTVMAAMEKLAVPRQDYYRWLPSNGQGYELEAEHPLTQPLYLHVVKPLSFVSDQGFGAAKPSGGRSL